ncbi:putative leader peptide [Actinomycetospora termitidis]|uniref:putative leader peptide n=1 Tax=Actinomycetospora termitidis TaxID=3053470 RepID=UPI003CE46734
MAALLTPRGGGARHHTPVAGGITVSGMAGLGAVRALDLMLVGRPHVDLARVASALCPAC